ncbi:hypothetical protein CC80DRAFT_156117 [Byssothecium circinans]|uniref:Uncharacterized protein n=1 Tax=Byssothecium circinans TaxID=147558 RepID=A0A6A5UBA1_9PLEO|nr:hypothetical protein CC80DRAFT_156117 [Byssothecium circinans]
MQHRDDSPHLTPATCPGTPHMHARLCYRHVMPSVPRHATHTNRPDLACQQIPGRGFIGAGTIKTGGGAAVGNIPEPILRALEQLKAMSTHESNHATLPLIATWGDPAAVQSPSSGSNCGSARSSENSLPDLSEIAPQEIGPAVSLLFTCRYNAMRPETFPFVNRSAAETW